MSEEDRTQFYLWLDNLRFPSTVPLLQSAVSLERGAPSQKVVLTHLEISQIDMIVQKIKDRCKLYDLEVGIHDVGDDP